MPPPAPQGHACQDNGRDDTEDKLRNYARDFQKPHQIHYAWLMANHPQLSLSIE